jgi:hypothetical protein
VPAQKIWRANLRYCLYRTLLDVKMDTLSGVGQDVTPSLAWGELLEVFGNVEATDVPRL